MAKKKIVKEVKTSKSFTYQIEDLNLNFNLFVDNNSGLVKFRKLLLEAVSDIDKLLEKK